MKTTALIIEFLVSGLLILFAVFSLFLSFKTEETLSILNIIIETYSEVLKSSIFALVFMAFAYSVGVVSEQFARSLFEWRLNQIKNKRLRVFKDSYARNINATGDLFFDHGSMRFYVLQNGNSLYEEISGQISRLRLVRVLFVTMLLVAIAVIWQLLSEPSALMALLLLVLIALLFVNGNAINRRFERYCRAIERSYLLLKLSPQDTQDTEPANKS